jgi:hypothetical protein
MKISMTRPIMRYLLHALLLVAPWALCATKPDSQPVAQDTIVASFDDGIPEGVAALGGTVEVVTDKGVPAAGAGCLKMTLAAKAGQKAYLKLPLPKGVNGARCAELVAQVRLSGVEGEIDLRWYALDADRKRILQRAFHLRKATGWTELRWSLASWRWADDRVGDWSEAASLVLQVSSRRGEVWLDEIRMTPGTRGEASAMPDQDWLKQLAFADRKSRVVCEDGVLVGTDAVDELSQDDLKRLAVQMKRVREWMGRLFGGAVRPVGKGAPVALLILRDRKDYVLFFRRLGEAWNVEIAPPDTGGYTVQDIAASTYSREYGIDRPVYLHEAVHAMAARNLRLLNGSPRHSWIEEGLANYLQVCVYPKSLDRKTYVVNFARPIDRGGKTFFKPLKTVLSGLAGAESYAQLGSIVGYLVAERPEWLGKIARALADGEDLEKVLKDCGTSIDELEKAWFAWGAKTFAPDAKPPSEGAIFPLPQEWGLPATTGTSRDSAPAIQPGRG